MAARILLVTATRVEALAVLADLPAAATVALGPVPGQQVQTPAGLFTVIVGGVGPMAAAATTAATLAHVPVDLVLCVGIAGGFGTELTAGDLVVADSMVPADLGVETVAGYLGPETFGAAVAFYPPAGLAEEIADRLRDAGLAASVGPVLTVATVTGTAARAGLLTDRHHGLAEAMEGAGVGQAAALYGCPAAELRAVSNLVGARDRAGWRISAALGALGAATAALAAAPLEALAPAAAP
ncbi:MAG TPA: futalosine hydrolase [Mycobacteriales bacterium]|nr:futalosine hydrolase [Mycobacteriales bacterium]